MIALMIHSYLIILVSVGLASLMIFLFGLYFIFAKARKKPPLLSIVPIEPPSVAWPVVAPIIKKEVSDKISSSDLCAIAGDDVLATQLDLARAYIESDKKHLAKKILETVMLQGSSMQQQEAKQLYLCVVKAV